MSKWIGETEKNLAALFDAAEDGDLILLFDEADSLFARRTEIREANEMGLIDGVTTNPSLVAKEGNVDFKEHLAKICEMVKGDIEGTTGYGIAPFEQDPEFPTVKVDLQKQTVDGIPFAEFIKDDAL